MKKSTILAVLSILLSSVSPAFAVTDKEMEEARAITAITYLRYANDASGYLDDYHPKSMADLQKVLKEKEKENLKTFTAVKSPSDYASWDKQKLIDYWAGTFYSSPGLLQKGKVGKSRTRSRLNAMTVGAPQQAKPAEAPKPAEPAAPAEQTKPAEPAEAAVAQTAAAETEGMPANGESAAAAAMAALDNAAPADSVPEAVNAEEEETPARKNNPAWIYFLILAVLVAVVVWLVVYASKTMKGENLRRLKEDAENGGGDRSGNVAERAANAAVREKYTESLNQKNSELRKASKEMADLKAELDAVMLTVERQTEELKAKDAEIERLRRGLAAIAAPERAASQPTAAPVRHPETHKRTIYLGRVNNRGLFVRADKTVNPDHSVYLLETEDGFSGTFRVISSPDVDRRLLANPTEWLAGGCILPDTDLSDATAIQTQSSGTAIFESSAWKVIRKAKITAKS